MDERTVHIWMGESLAVGGDGVWPVGEAQGGTHGGTEDGRGPLDGMHRAKERPLSTSQLF